MQDWALELLEGCEKIATTIDNAENNDESTFALNCQRKKLMDPELTPSARILAQMRDQSIPFFRFAMNASIAHSGYYADHPLRDARLKEFKELASNSIAEQKAIGEAETESFEDFLDHYLALP